jgi:hypothetical protein
MHTGLMVKKLEGKNSLDDLGVHEKIIQSNL